MGNAIQNLLWSAKSFGVENGGSYYGGHSCGETVDAWLPFVFIFVPIFIFGLRWWDKVLWGRRK